VRVPAKSAPVRPRSRRTETIEPWPGGASATYSACWITFCNASIGSLITCRCASRHGMPSGNRSAQVAAGTDKAATRPASAPMTRKTVKSAPTVRGRCKTSQETDSGLKKEIQHEGEYDGKDDRACHVERRQSTQSEQTTEEERPRIARQRHFRLFGGLRHRRRWLWQTIIRQRRGAL
jgi:hypothetical protein